MTTTVVTAPDTFQPTSPPWARAPHTFPTSKGERRPELAGRLGLFLGGGTPVEQHDQTEPPRPVGEKTNHGTSSSGNYSGSKGDGALDELMQLTKRLFPFSLFQFSVSFSSFPRFPVLCLDDPSNPHVLGLEVG